MATPIAITDPADPRLEPYRAMRERDLAGRGGRFIVEGEVVLRLALTLGRFPLESVLLSERRLQGSPELAGLIPPGTALYAAGDAIIEAVAGFAVHRGVLAVGLRGVDAPLAALTSQSPSLVVAGIGLANHDNMGSLFRNAAAFGADAVLLDGTSCDPLYRKAIRVSVGAALLVPFRRSGAGMEIVRSLQDAGYTTYALSPSGESDLSSVTPEPRSALVVGAEGPGLPADLMARMRTIRIPMAAGFDSLNVGTATGVALHHFAVGMTRLQKKNP